MQLTTESLDNLMILWREKTNTEDELTMEARDLIDHLLEARHCAIQFDKLEKEKAAA